MNQQYIFDRIEIDPGSGCWNWKPCKSRDGYGVASYKSRNIRAHRFSWMIFKGDIPTGQCVLHRCDNPSCVNPDHLFVGTHKDNVHDKLAKGRGRRTKYTKETIEMIRQSPLGDAELSRSINIHATTINDIRHFRKQFK